MEEAAPVPGSVLELPGEGAFRVETVGRSPYPDDPRRCAFALPVRDFALGREPGQNLRSALWTFAQQS